MDFLHEKDRIFLHDKAGKTIAEVTFPELEPGIVTIDHTFVDETLRGQQIAGKLMEQAACQIRQSGKKLRCTCSYAVKWFDKHQEEYQDILL